MIKDSAKTILCYGDSNTWGADPKTGDRHPRSIRWPYILQSLLGDDYEVISEGLPGRTLVAEDPGKPHRTGITHLKAMIESVHPVDLIIVMLGTNDIKTIYNLSAEDIASHLDQTLKLIESKSEKTLVICPAQTVVPESGEVDPRMVRAPEILSKIPELFKEVAEKNSCSYLNAGDFITSSKVDGYHLDPEAHQKLAEVIRTKIESIGL